MIGTQRNGLHGAKNASQPGTGLMPALFRTGGPPLCFKQLGLKVVHVDVVMKIMTANARQYISKHIDIYFSLFILEHDVDCVVYDVCTIMFKPLHWHGSHADQRRFEAIKTAS